MAACIPFLLLALVAAPARASQLAEQESRTLVTIVPHDTQEEPGLLITGDVLTVDPQAGVPGASIYRAYASYGGSLVATTDTAGHYEADFAYIPGDEMVAVWAAKAGFSLDPQQYYWRHYYGFETRILNFEARPLVTDCPAPLPVPNRVLVNRGSWITGELSYYLDLYLGRDSAAPTAAAVITVTHEAGSISQASLLTATMPTTLIIPLQLDTVHHLTVYAQFTVTTDCSYVTSTRYDLTGNPLTVVQAPSYRLYLALTLR